jgi:hypothetical protein
MNERRGTDRDTILYSELDALVFSGAVREGQALSAS